MLPNTDLALGILDVFPNPVLVKNDKLEYVFVNQAFEKLFGVVNHELQGKIDSELFPDRQVAQCNGGDLRVLESGDVDDAEETIFRQSGEPRVMITRKNRLTTGDGSVFLVGVMHDVNDITQANKKLERAQKELTELASKLADQATTDQLTGCHNRHFLQTLEADVFTDESTESSLLIIDVDYFKNINDTFGHALGDEALRHLVSTLRSSLQSHQHLIRLGGEEFAIVLQDTKPEHAEKIAETLRESVENSSLPHQDGELRFTVSIGIAHKQQGVAVPLQSMLSQTDKALYEAKSAGRNTVRLAA